MRALWVWNLALEYRLVKKKKKTMRISRLHSLALWKVSTSILLHDRMVEDSRVESSIIRISDFLIGVNVSSRRSSCREILKLLRFGTNGRSGIRKEFLALTFALLPPILDVDSGRNDQLLTRLASQ